MKSRFMAQRSARSYTVDRTPRFTHKDGDSAAADELRRRYPISSGASQLVGEFLRLTFESFEPLAPQKTRRSPCHTKTLISPQLHPRPHDSGEPEAVEAQVVRANAQRAIDKYQTFVTAKWRAQESKDLQESLLLPKRSPLI